MWTRERCFVNWKDVEINLESGNTEFWGGKNVKDFLTKHAVRVCKCVSVCACVLAGGKPQACGVWVTEAVSRHDWVCRDEWLHLREQHDSLIKGWGSMRNPNGIIRRAVEGSDSEQQRKGKTGEFVFFLRRRGLWVTAVFWGEDEEKKSVSLSCAESRLPFHTGQHRWVSLIQVHTFTHFIINTWSIVKPHQMVISALKHFPGMMSFFQAR